MNGVCDMEQPKDYLEGDITKRPDGDLYDDDLQDNLIMPAILFSFVFGVIVGTLIGLALWDAQGAQHKTEFFL